MWADSQNGEYISLIDDTFNIRARNGLQVHMNAGVIQSAFINEGNGPVLITSSHYASGAYGGAVTFVNNAAKPALFVQNQSGQAALFSGNVQINGSLSKSSGSFKIDHPLDPTHKYLYHSFVESPDMMNVYNGNVILDGSGEGIVQLPDWFGALNRDYRYQLTCIGGAALVYVAEEIKDNRFKIAGGNPGLKVSWQVTGIRQDAYANAHRIVVEEEKPAEERGKYLHPAEFGQPASMGLTTPATAQAAQGTVR